MGLFRTLSRLVNPHRNPDVDGTNGKKRRQSKALSNETIMAKHVPSKKKDIALDNRAPNNDINYLHKIDRHIIIKLLTVTPPLTDEEIDKPLIKEIEEPPRNKKSKRLNKEVIDKMINFDNKFTKNKRIRMY